MLQLVLQLALSATVTFALVGALVGEASAILAHMKARRAAEKGSSP
jgi:hypothetical protein